MSYRVLIVEDHKIMRDGIKALLDRSSEFAVVGDVETGAEAIQSCTEIHPDIVLMDIGLPGLNGVDSTAELLRHCPSTRVIMLSMYDDEDSVVSSIRAGARGYVVHQASSADLLDAPRHAPLPHVVSATRHSHTQHDAAAAPNPPHRESV